VWTACWDGSRVVRRRSDGSVDRELGLPVPLVTSCCFGGPGLDILFVTSARVGMNPAALEAAPLSGGLFAIRGLGVRGRSMERFGG
jgi:sugar lactone lactonase YvrE